MQCRPLIWIPFYPTTSLQMKCISLGYLKFAHYRKNIQNLEPLSAVCLFNSSHPGLVWLFHCRITQLVAPSGSNINETVVWWGKKKNYILNISMRTPEHITIRDTVDPLYNYRKYIHDLCNLHNLCNGGIHTLGRPHRADFKRGLISGTWTWVLIWGLKLIWGVMPFQTPGTQGKGRQQLAVQGREGKLCAGTHSLSEAAGAQPASHRGKMPPAPARIAPEKLKEKQPFKKQIFLCTLGTEPRLVN